MFVEGFCPLACRAVAELPFRYVLAILPSRYAGYLSGAERDVSVPLHRLLRVMGRLGRDD